MERVRPVYQEAASNTLNQALFVKITVDHKHYIITEDLNGLNKLRNNGSITNPRGKSVLYLTLTSRSLAQYKHTFTVLNDQITNPPSSPSTTSNAPGGK